MAIETYLNKNVSTLLEAEPFRNWRFERSEERDIEDPTIYYSFKQKGLDISCSLDNKINVIFLHTDKNCHELETLSGIPFLTTQAGIRQIYGVPTKAGSKMSDPFLGEYGPWDLFSKEAYSLHFQFRHDMDLLKLITIMVNDVVPE